LGMRTAEVLVVALADGLAVAHEGAAHHRVRLDPAFAARGQLQRARHVPSIEFFRRLRLKWRHTAWRASGALQISPAYTAWTSNRSADRCRASTVCPARRRCRAPRSRVPPAAWRRGASPGDHPDR